MAKPDSAVLSSGTIRCAADRSRRNYLVSRTVPRTSVGSAERRDPFLAEHAGSRPADLHRFRDAAASTGDILFLNHARDHVLWVRFSNQHHAAMVAVPHLR